MIRVLHIVTDMRCGGLETMLMNYYRAIDRKNVQFDFLEHRPDESDYDREIKELGGRIYRIPRLNPFSVRYKLILRKFFREHPEYRIVHVHQDCLSGIILKEAKRCGVKVRIAHSHSSNQDKNLKLLVKLYYKRKISDYATDLLACSQEAGKWMFCGSDFKVLNNAINMEKYVYSKEIRHDIRKQFQIPKETLVIGHVGRFSYPKNHTYLLDIFKKISDQMDAVLVLVGDGELRKKIEDKILQLRLKDRVILTGIRSDVSDLLQAMDVFLFPSLYEGLPVTIVEAQAAGLPCLISDKVPIECKKTELVHQISLEEDIMCWVNEAIEVSKMERKNMSKEIQMSGFDIGENAKKLAGYYMNKVKDNYGE